LIDNIKWSVTKGTYPDEKLLDIKKFIENELSNSSAKVFGNPIK
jgi:hypothetical protein